MLIGQLSTKQTEITKSIGASAPGLSATISEKSIDDRNIYQDLFKVVSTIENIGKTYDVGKEYISGPLDMSWGYIRGTPDAIYWAGNNIYADCRVKVLLIGSAKNMIGNIESGNFLSYSHLFYFLDAYANDLEINSLSTPTPQTLMIVLYQKWSIIFAAIARSILCHQLIAILLPRFFIRRNTNGAA